MTTILTTLCILGKQCAGIESLAGSGKSKIADTVLKLLPKEYIYEVGVGSDTSVTYQENEINNAFLIYIPELQKAENNKLVTEVLKNLGEGKDFERAVTVTDTEQKPDGSKKFRRHIEKQKIKKKHFLYTLALENKHKKDEELSRRVLTFTTDITSEQNKRVIKTIGERRSRKKYKNLFTQPEFDLLKAHCKEVADLDIKEIYDPFGEYFSSKVPEGFTIVRSYISHYFNLIDACAKFHYKQRLIKDGILFVSLEDYKLVHELFAIEFNHRIHNLPNLGSSILECFDTNEEDHIGWKKNNEKAQQTLYTEQDTEERLYLSLADIHKQLKKKSLLVKYKVIQDQIDLLIEAGFLAENKIGKTPAYFRQDYLHSFETNFDWNEFKTQGEEIFKEEMSDYYKEWQSLDSFVEPSKPEEKEVSNEVTDTPEQNSTTVTSTPSSRILALLGLVDEAEIDYVLKSCKVTEAELNKLKTKGDIYEPKSGVVALIK